MKGSSFPPHLIATFKDLKSNGFNSQTRWPKGKQFAVNSVHYLLLFQTVCNKFKSFFGHLQVMVQMSCLKNSVYTVLNQLFKPSEFRSKIQSGTLNAFPYIYMLECGILTEEYNLLYTLFFIKLFLRHMCHSHVGI